MSTGAVVTMVGGMVAIWGGLAASLILTLTRAKATANEQDRPPPAR